MRHHIRDVTFGEDAATSRTGRGPVNLATIRAVIAAFKDAGYLHVPEGRRDRTTPVETLHLHGLDYDRCGHSRNTPEPWVGTGRASYPGPGPPKGDPGGE